jgi:uncharacterized protein (TIGR02678 family)
MAPPRAAAGISPSDLGSYQQAVRLVLTHDIITGSRPRPGVLDQVLRWADQLTRDLRELLGYTLIATTRQVRLTRRLDAFDPGQGTMFAKNGRPFDRRRLAYLCLVLASFQRSRVELSLADLVRAFAPAANAIDGLGFDATVTAHKAAVVDVLDWLVERGALQLSDGSLEAWARDSERGDALYDIDHDICAALFKPARPLQHLTSAAGLLDAPFVSAKRGAQRAAAAQRAARALVEYPVVYYAQTDPETGDALRLPGVAENLARLTGLAVERRAEGVLLADSGGRFTDRPFPGRGGAVNRAAGLLLAKIADVLEDPGETLTRIELPSEAEDQRDLLTRIDSALPADGIVHELAWSAPAGSQDSWPEAPLPVPAGGAVMGGAGMGGAGAGGAGAGAPAGSVPLIEDSRLRAMMDELYGELGAAAFTITWQHDPRGLLEAATAFLAGLRLLRPVRGGVLVLPAAARYRNIKLALPARHAGDGQMAMFFGAADAAGDGEGPT